MSKQANGSGSVYKRADGRYEVRVTDPRSGRRRSAYAATERDAARLLRGMVANVDTGRSALGSGATLRTWAADWFDSGRAGRKGRRPSTVRAYRARLEAYVLPELGGIRLRDLTPLDVDDLADALSRRRPALSASSIKGALTALQACLDDAVRGRLLEVNPAARVEVPERAARTRPVTVPTTDQVRALLARVEGTALEPVVILLAGTGARIGEALAARWDDLDLEHGTWTVRATITTDDAGSVVVGERTKTGAVRRVALAPVVVEALRVQRHTVARARLAAGPVWRDHGLVFPSSVGTPQHSQNVRKPFRVAAAAAGFPGSFHALRHYVASVGLSQMEPAVIAKQLGHAKASLTTDLYGHLMADDSAALASALASTLDRGAVYGRDRLRQ